MTWPDYEAAADVLDDWLRQRHGITEPGEAVKHIIEAALGDTVVYVRKMELKKKCWHTGSYRSHDEGCYELVYVQVWPEEDTT